MKTSLSLYLDHTGYALIEFTYNNGKYSINYINSSDRTNGKELVALAEKRVSESNISEVYYNSSLFLKRLLYSLKFEGYKTEVKIGSEESEDKHFSFDDGFQIINSLLNSDSLEVSKEYSNIFQSNLKTYNHPEINHVVFSLFVGIAKVELNRLDPPAFGFTSVPSPHRRLYSRSSARDIFSGYGL